MGKETLLQGEEEEEDDFAYSSSFPHWRVTEKGGREKKKKKRKKRERPNPKGEITNEFSSQIRRKRKLHIMSSLSP